MPKNQVIIITGAAGNLGAAVAERLAAEDARLVLVDRLAEPLQQLAVKLAGARTLILPGIDLSDTMAARTMIKMAEDHFGAIGGLVNTVGGFKTGKVAEDALDHWDMMMTLNARVAAVTSAAVLPVMVAQSYGRIVHIAAGPGLRAGAGQAAYAASKAAVIRLVESISEEHRKDHVTANAILPGTIDTPQNRAAMPNAKTDGWIKPEAIAALIAFLVSGAGGVVTGGAIPATGLVSS